MMKLLGVVNTKLVKGEKQGYRTYGLSLAPSRVSGYQVCASASPGCAKACLYMSGMGNMKSVQRARIAKTRWFFEDRDTFMLQLVKEIAAAVKSARKVGMIPVFRLNVVSDIRWETIPVPASLGVQTALPNQYPNIMAVFPQVQFYDYTKHTNRNILPANYHLTLSRSETNEQQIMSSPFNIAVVFHQELPTQYLGRRVMDGTDTDLRFLDPENVVVGLVANGRGKQDHSGFVVKVKDTV